MVSSIDHKNTHKEGKNNCSIIPNIKVKWKKL